MIKSRGAKGKARVTFTVDPGVGAQTAAVCGDWNGWLTDADVMRRDAEGGFSLTVELEAGRAYRFRYFLDGQRWDNDWAADAYLASSFGGDDSVVDLTALAEPVPAAATKAPVKKTPAKKEAAAHKEATGPTTKKAAPGAEPAMKKPPAKKQAAAHKEATGPTTKKAAPGAEPAMKKPPAKKQAAAQKQATGRATKKAAPGAEPAVDLTALAEPVPAAAKKAPVKKIPAKKEAAAQKPATGRTTKRAAPGAEPARKTTK